MCVPLPLTVDMPARADVCLCASVILFVCEVQHCCSMPTPLKYLEILLEEKKHKIFKQQNEDEEEKKTECKQSIYGNMCMN